MDTLIIQKADGHTVITFRSETISFFNVAPLKEKMEELAKEGETVVVLDFTAVRFVDSAGVGGILVACMRLSRQGGRVLAVGVKDRVKKILEYVDRDGVIAYFDTLEEAQASLAG